MDGREALGGGMHGDEADGGEVCESEALGGGVRDAEVLDSGGALRSLRSPRRATWAVLPVAVVLLVAVAIWPRPTGPGAAPGAPGVAATPQPDVAIARETAPGIRIGVERAEEGRLPRLETALPERLSTHGAVSLSAAPMTRALALLQWSGEGGPGPVLALGDDGGLRALDGVKLTTPTDEDGNEQLPLDDTALSPDGRRAAFPQRDEVVVVNLIDGTSRRWPLPGFNEIVSWRPDGVTLVVEQEERVFLVDSRTGRAERQPYPGFETVAGGEPGTDVHRLSDAADLHRPRTTEPAKTELTRWDASGNLLARESSRLTVGTGERWGPGWLRGGRIAWDVFGAGGPRHGGIVEAEAIVVLDAATGRQSAALVLPGTDRWKGCCRVLGWYDEDTVLFASRGGPSRLLAWRVSSGELLRVADLPDGAAVALGDIRGRPRTQTPAG
ncbi:hypothetical protein GCM10010156_05930 [Planobispora rosea]|uniref:WD40 repeat domain-containing protein n=1 Tax=Planobispora rosea TaxID=35762 RepID=A0A8J3S163_PLARO|nr:hypothetical protein [Planobispora rosea]GGS50029.1 hypothetical protein GCM10010156_05930 [Planobispora rosea]GIH83877.1 hypothetical protein Pro02_22850 [Planobispora rosea]